MWFLIGLFGGVILGFFFAGLCNIIARTGERYIEHCTDFLEGEIKNPA